MRLRSSGNLPNQNPEVRMAEGVGSPVPSGTGIGSGTGTPGVQVMHHKVLTQPINVRLFKGRIKQAPCDVESYITAVEAHLNSKGVQDEETAYAEALTFMDLSPECEGDIRTFVLGFGNNFKTWTQLKAKLREVYRSLGSDDPIANLARILRKGNEDTSDNLRYGPTCFTRLQEWKEVVKNSPWMKEGKCSLEDMAELIGMAHMLSRLPEGLVNSFTHKWKPGEGMAKIDKLVQEGKIRNPNVDQSLLGTVAVVNKPYNGETNGNYKFGENPRSRYERNSRGQGRQTVVCHNCKKKGHLQRECWAPPFCSYHGVCKHRTEECRSRGRRHSPQGNRWQRDRSRSRSKSRSKPRNPKNTGNNKENFHLEEILPLTP